MAKVSYWKDSDILNIKLKKGKFKFSAEIAKGVVLDISKGGEILAVEILNASKRLTKSLSHSLSAKYAVAR